MRVWMKASPLSDREKYRERILSTAIGRIRSERNKNINKLRNGDEDVDGLARHILYNAVSDGSASQLVSSSSSAFKNSDLNLTRTMNPSGSESMNDIDADGFPKFHRLDVDDHDLYLQLMDQIAEELKSEYYSNINELLQYEYDEQTEQNEIIDWSVAVEDIDDEIICPVCRISNIKITEKTGRCSCGLVLPLFDGKTGEFISMQTLADKLADVHDRHSMVCDYDGSVSPLALDPYSRRHSGANTPYELEMKMNFESDSTYFPRYDTKSNFSPQIKATTSTETIKTTMQTETNVSTNLSTKYECMSESICDESTSAQGDGNLVFSQNQYGLLVCVCTYCGFEETIL